MALAVAGRGGASAAPFDLSVFQTVSLTTRVPNASPLSTTDDAGRSRRASVLL